MDNEELGHIYDSIPSDVSMLNRRSVLRYIKMQTALGNTCIDSVGDNKSMSLAVRSSIDPRLWYEFIHVKFGDKEDLFIYVCIAEHQDAKPKREFCFYANGDILSWGLWIAELSIVFPSMYEDCAWTYNNKLLKKYEERLLLPKTGGNSNPQRAVEQLIVKSNFFSSVAVNEHTQNRKIRIE